MKRPRVLRLNETHICFHPGFLLEINFVFCACICLSFFYAIIGLSCNCFFYWYARDAGFSHMYTELKTAFVMQCEDPFLGWGEVVPYIIGYNFNTYYQILF